MVERGTTGGSPSLRAVLASQYHAALAMLRSVIERFPEELWLDDGHRNAPWQIAYHALFFTHFYLSRDEASFVPWERHQRGTQNPDAIGGPPDPDSTLPVIPEPYPKADVLAYWQVCDDMIEDAVDALDLDRPESGFYWYPISKLEHQIVNIRHIQHHAAQLGDRLRQRLDEGTGWVGAGRPVST